MRLELMLGLRYLMAKRKMTFVSIITFLCVIGILVGDMVMITVLSVMNGFQEDIRDKILGTRSHINISAYGEEPLTNYKNIISVAKSDTNVISAYEYISMPAIMRTYTFTTLINVHSVDGEIFEKDKDFIKYFDFVEGKADLFSSETNVLIGKEMALNYAITIGDSIDIITAAGSFDVGLRPQKKTVVVSGIYKTGYYEYDSKLVIVPLALAKDMAGYNDAVTGIALKISDFYEADKVALDLNEKTHKQYNVMPWMLLDRNFFNALRTEKTMLGLILSFIILVASLNIASSQIIFVKEKRRDIAIIKTLGMRPSNIAKIFFLEGVVIGLIGTIFGVITGILLATHINETLSFVRALLQFFANVIFFIPSIISADVIIPYIPEFFPQDIYYVSGLPSIIYPSHVIFVASVSFILSVIFAIIPAYIASKYRPAQVLRYE